MEGKEEVITELSIPRHPGVCAHSWTVVAHISGSHQLIHTEHVAEMQDGLQRTPLSADKVHWFILFIGSVYHLTHSLCKTSWIC